MKKILTLFFYITFTTAKLYSQNTNPEDPANKKVDSLLFKDKTIATTKPEVEPLPDVDKNSWQNFLKKNINYDIAAFNEPPVGKYIVKVKFTIFTDGHLGDFIALTKFGYGMEREVIHALKKSPNWKPGFQNGKFVNASRVQTITFLVE